MKRILLAVWGVVLALPIFAATLSTPVPDGSCPTLTGYTVTCTANGAPPPVVAPPVVAPPVAVPPAGAAEMTWNTTSGTRYFIRGMRQGETRTWFFRIPNLPDTSAIVMSGPIAGGGDLSPVLTVKDVAGNVLAQSANTFHLSTSAGHRGFTKVVPGAIGYLTVTFPACPSNACGISLDFNHTNP